MITFEKYTEIFNEVKKCINDTLIHTKETALENYILFLANAEYKEECDNPQSEMNPYIIDDQIEDFKDENRLRFLVDFLRKYYSFPEPQTIAENDEYRFNIELMIYTHIWESKPFLKKLFRLAQLGNLEPYCWNVNVPEMRKSVFIEKDIKKTLKKNKNPLFAVIEKGFHSSLRNAFAHSEYVFDTSNENCRIWLGNRKRSKGEINDILFDDWSQKFVYSVLLSYHLIAISDQHRKNLVQEIGKDIYTINYPFIIYKNVEIIYRPETNEFIFNRK